MFWNRMSLKPVPKYTDSEEKILWLHYLFKEQNFKNVSILQHLRNCLVYVFLVLRGLLGS